MEFVQIEVARQGYSPSDVARKTLTVAELRETLDNYPDDMPVIFSHDNGYTYGGIGYSDITDGHYADEVEDSYGEGEEGDDGHEED